jgi:hypothetical protein
MHTNEKTASSIYAFNKTILAFSSVNLSMTLLNVNGLQNREKRGRAIEWVKSMKKM